MAQETVDIFETIAKGTVTLGELRDALSKAKEKLSELNVGEGQYQEKLKEVITLQNLVKGAMHGTTADMEDLSKAADGTAHSYNGLVNQMANMKRELRNIDTSTAKGKKDFDDLAKEIKKVNDELKGMDEQQGSFVRNVGNYTSGLKNLGEILKDNIPVLGTTAKQVGNVDKAVHLLGQQPILGIIGLLAPLITDIANGLKDNDKAMNAINKTMESMKPIMDFFTGLLDQVVGFLADIIDRVSKFLSSSGLFNQIVQGVVGVGNAIAKFIISPFKGIIAAIKVFQDEGVKGLRNAGKAFLSEMKEGVAFKSNFEAGQAMADGLISGAKSRKKDVKAAGKEVGKQFGDGVIEGLDEILNKIDEKWNKRLEERQKQHEKRVADIAAYNKEQAERFLKEQEEEADALANEWYESYQKQVQDAKEAAEQKMAIMTAYADGTSNLMNNIADLLETEGDESENSVKAAKNLRIAAATIDMISGAVTAFSTAQQLGPIAGPIVGAINAAAVVASGLANIAKIRSTNVSKQSASSTAAPETPSATVSAPAVESAIPTTTVVEGASQEQRLNRAAEPQKVYILQSDIEAAGDASRVQVAESSF